MAEGQRPVLFWQDPLALGHRIIQYKLYHNQRSLQALHAATLSVCVAEESSSLEE